METTDELVVVYTLSDPIKAEIIKNALAVEGIRCFLDGMNQMVGPGVPVFTIHVQVAPEDAERAAQFIRQHEAAAADETAVPAE